MFGSKKRPWKNVARVTKVELFNGDVKYRIIAAEALPRDEFETLDAATAYLDTWYEGWRARQVKSTRRA